METPAGASSLALEAFKKALGEDVHYIDPSELFFVKELAEGSVRARAGRAS